MSNSLNQNIEQEKKIQKIADNISLLVSTDGDLLNQFNKNLKAFKKFDSNIYDFFKEYKPSQYVVDIKDGFPNIFDVKTRQHLYQYPAYLLTQTQVKEYQKSPLASSMNFETDYKNHGNFIHVEYLNKIIDIYINGTKNKTEKNSKLPHEISTLMIFGVGIGYHIEQLCQEHNIYNLYVLEPNLDLFYCSLFTVDWKAILTKFEANNAHFHLILGENKEGLFDDIVIQGQSHGQYDFSRMYWYRHYSNDKTQSVIDMLKTRYHQLNYGWGFFDDGVMSIGHFVNSVEQKTPILKKRSLNQNCLSDSPVFIVGSGPSLDSLIEFIKTYQDKAIIISCGSALSALYNYGIVPDIHCEQERTRPVRDKLDYYGKNEVIKAIPFIGPSTLHPDAFDFFDHSLMALKGNEPSSVLFIKSIQDKRSLFEIHNYINPTVANTALSMGYGMGFKNFYFLGVDLAYKDRSKHHSNKSFYFNEDGNDLNKYDASGYLKVKGNFSGNFYTDKFFDVSKLGLELFIRQAEDINCYNLSDGAFIDGVKPLNIENARITSPTIISKKDKLIQLIDLVGYSDSDLSEKLKENVDFNSYETFCYRLIKAMDSSTSNSIKDCILLLKKQTVLLQDIETTSDVINFSILKGSITYFQSSLLKLIYDVGSESSALKAFKEGLSVYKSFLIKSVEFYQKNALIPHYCKNDWLDSLKNINTEK